MSQDPPDCPLSHGEIAVLQAAADLGGTTGAAQIADRLSVSPETVRTHWRNILAKLGTHNRSAALYEAVQRGWVRCGPSRAPGSA